MKELSEGLAEYRPGQTGLLRLSWDNGDRTVLVNPELGGMTLGWNMVHTAKDELFAAIEGTAFHTRIILERMAEFGVPVHRVINAGGIPQHNAVLNQVYADVLGKPVLVPDGVPTSLGSGYLRWWRRGCSRRLKRRRRRCVCRSRRMRRRLGLWPGITSCLRCIGRFILRLVRGRVRRRLWAMCCRSCGGLRLRCAELEVVVVNSLWIQLKGECDAG